MIIDFYIKNKSFWHGGVLVDDIECKALLAIVIILYIR